jgi:hypothetical protein
MLCKILSSFPFYNHDLQSFPTWVLTLSSHIFTNVHIQWKCQQNFSWGKFLKQLKQDCHKISCRAWEVHLAFLNRYRSKILWILKKLVSCSKWEARDSVVRKKGSGISGCLLKGVHWQNSHPPVARLDTEHTASLTYRRQGLPGQGPFHLNNQTLCVAGHSSFQRLWEVGYTELLNSARPQALAPDIKRKRYLQIDCTHKLKGITCLDHQRKEV